MCGICGWGRAGGEDPSPQVLPRMVDQIRHRGPDKQEHLRFDAAGLGIARLAINDVEGGHQPYRNETGEISAVFNGEIYNFREIRAELESRGHRFASKTDGEVIVHLYEEMGPDFVERLNGMFAIAIWDGKQLSLYRDRMGIKPLYYGVVRGVLYFASELKSLLEIEGLTRRLDRAALRSYLSLEYVPGPASIFEEFRKLPPAHRLILGPDGERLERYWSFPHFAPQGGSLEEWTERLRDGLTDAVRVRLVADVPLGVFLSGGLDSSTLTSLMCRLHSDPVHTFSVGFEEETFDESSYSALVARKLGTVHHHRQLDSASALDAIGPLYAQLDEPLADPALIPTLLLSQFAREKVTVALSGEGADELLAGYPTYFAHQLARVLDALPRPLWRLVGAALERVKASHSYLSLDFKAKKFVSGMGQPDLERHLTWMGAMTEGASAGMLLSPVAPSLNLGSFLFPDTVVEKAQTLDFHTYLVDDLLVKLDRATMMVSLEGRVPFLDHRLVETMAGLPTAHKLRLLDAKRVLKRVERSRLPPEVVGRRKKGFGVPIASWLCGPLRPLMEELLSPTYLRDQGLFQVAPVRRLVEEHLALKADNRKPLWTLLVFQQWFQAYRPSL